MSASVLAVLVAALTALVVVPLMAAAAWLAFGWFGAWRLNRYTPRFEDSMFSPFEMAVDAEDVELTTRDGVRLHGWFLRRPETRRVVLALHGYRGNKTHLLGISSNLWRMGFNVLVFDFRGRGESRGVPMSMGLWEVEDLAAALEWVGTRVSKASVGLLGFSMGGVVALLGGADPRVHAIVADSAFPDQRAVLEHAVDRDAGRWLRGWIRGRSLLPVMEWWHRRWGKPPFDAIAPERALDRLAGTPLLFIHGTADRWIPMGLAERLIAAAPQPKDAWILRGVEHCGAYFADRMAYSARVAAFFDRHLATSRESAPGATKPAAGALRTR